MKIVNLKKEEFESFAETHPLKNFYQTTSYGNVMKNFGFESTYIGFVEAGSLIGASLVLNKPVFMGLKYGYAPHGILINYKDFNLLENAMKKLKTYLLRQGYLVIKIDPLIIKSKRDKEGNVLEKNKDFEQIMKTLNKVGFTHCGFNNYMESVKPRWHAELVLKDHKVKELFYNLEKQVRNKLRKSIKFGVEVYQDNNDIESAYQFIKEKGNYSLKYYKELKEKYKDNLEIYFAKVNTENYVYNSQVLYEKEADINDYLNNIIQNEGSKGKDMHTVLNKKMESDKVLASYKNHLLTSTELLKQNPESLVIGAAIIIKQNNKIYLLIDGFSKKYKNLCPGYLIKWKIIEKYSESNIDVFDLNAVSGNFTSENVYKGLNESKASFNTDIIEYIGEFNLITNKPMYSLYRNTKDKYNLKEQKK